LAATVRSPSSLSRSPVSSVTGEMAPRFEADEVADGELERDRRVGGKPSDAFAAVAVMRRPSPR
jgi:hypothetical protein